MTLRAPRAAAAWFKEKDAQTAVTESFIRKLIADGEIPCIRNGKKILIDVEAAYQFLEAKTGGDADA